MVPPGRDARDDSVSDQPEAGPPPIDSGTALPMAGVVPRRVLFLGVTTSESSVHRAFPAWMDAFGLGGRVTLEGVDLPIGAPAAGYAAFVDRVRGDASIAGAVVTTHKAALFEACEGRFDAVTGLAAMLREVGGISRAGGTLTADAPDARSVARVAAHLLTDARWVAGPRRAVILGAGGAGLSLAYGLCDGPPEIAARSIVMTDVDPARVDAARAVASRWRRSTALVVDHARAGANDSLIRGAPEGTLIVNASGVGKDRPGSPLAADVLLPRQSIYWDFNYRGTLELLRSARAQADERDLLVADGADYLVRGWLEALCFVLGRAPTEPLLRAFDVAVRAALA